MAMRLIILVHSNATLEIVGWKWKELRGLLDPFHGLSLVISGFGKTV
jgi:hypothetical protein